jgi:hypothetical protein
LFLFSDAVEEAALVLANHLQDLQLVLVVTRRCGILPAWPPKNWEYRELQIWKAFFRLTYIYI